MGVGLDPASDGVRRVRPLRVGYVTAFLRPGGAERQMLALAERLPRDRFSVEFVLISGTGGLEERAIRAGARLRALDTTPSMSSRAPVRAARRAGKIVRYATAVKSGRYDIVDAWLYPADVLAALMRTVTRTPIIVSGRRNIDPEHSFGPLERPLRALARGMTDAVIANSDATAAHAVRMGNADRAKVRVIRNGVAPNPSISQDERMAQRRALHLDADDVVIGAVANYHPVKRLDLLVEAVAVLVGRGLPVRLVLVGDGSERTVIERRVADLGLQRVVDVHGLEAEPERLLPAFDIVAQASSREGMPNALLEAAAAGRPVAATAAGGSSEVVVDGQTGFLVPVGDFGSLVGALDRLVVDAALRQRLGAAARERAKTVFGMDRFVSEFAALYEELAAAKGIVR